MSRILTILFAVLVFTSSASYALTAPDKMPSGIYTMDKSHASLIFKVNHLGLSNYTARFKDFNADLDFNPADVTKSKLKVSVNPASVETDYPNPEQKDFNKKISEEKEWFNSKKFPTINFESTSIKKTGENTGKVNGKLTFLGITKPVTLDVNFNGAYDSHPMDKKTSMIGFSAKTKIKRSKFGMNVAVPYVGDDVDVIIEMEFRKENK